MRIGVHTGDAIKEAEQYIGSTVHFAARVAGQAIGGEVLVSSAVYELVHASTPAVMFLEGREVELKGIAGPHRVYGSAPDDGPAWGWRPRMDSGAHEANYLTRPPSTPASPMRSSAVPSHRRRFWCVPSRR